MVTASGGELSWPEKQRVKNDLFGVDRAAVEVFPRGEDMVDAADVFHLWVYAGEMRRPQLVPRAQAFAAAAHAAVGQVRKYTFAPYIEHPAAVAKIVQTVPHTAEMVAAAWLHDVVEDTGVTSQQIAAEFGTAVGELVFWLTDQSRPEDGNREARKAIDRAHSAAAPPEAQTIKLADLIDNTASIKEHDPGFAEVYRREKRQLLEVMTKGDPALMAIALKQVREA